MLWLRSSAGREGGAGAPLWLVWPLAVAGYVLMGRLGLVTAVPPTGAVVLWPPNAVLLTALLASAPRHWPVVLLGGIAAEVAVNWHTLPIAWALAFGAVNAAESTLAASLLRRFSDGPVRLDGLAAVVRFVLLAPLAASATAALAGAALIALRFPKVDYLHTWQVFWLGDGLGLLIVGTTLLVWLAPRAAPEAKIRGRGLEGLVLAAGLLFVSVLTLRLDADLGRLYLLFPFLVWTALRFGMKGATLAILSMTGIATWAMMDGRGPFVDLAGIDQVAARQVLIAVVALSTFILAVAADERRRVTRRLLQSVRELEQARFDLERMNADLDEIVTERTRALRSTLARNEMLLREVHHRVKNNLQLISSLVALQRRGVQEPAMRERMARIQGQIGAIAKTYDLLHQFGASETVDFGPFVPALCAAIEGAEGGRARIEAELQGSAQVSADSAIALSLALNELVTNALKHAGPTPRIRVSCGREGDALVLRVEDDGPGLPEGFDLTAQAGFGVRMVAGLIGQAGGTIRTLATEGGAAFEIRVPVTGAA
ncbi:sensor histidine kinase [Cereibacter sphaeroides]|uniref:sensor histidine kinase n=1 Tax=Cereibacter sphaeroides TaxID=1063 RepID=UPI0009B65A80|nr:MASE1 domain-containing protein [Cereibacter sphaeroides]